MVWISVCLVLVFSTNVKGSGEWGYFGRTGPSNWHGTCSTGTSQSPIDIPVDHTHIITFADDLQLSGFDLDVAGATPSSIINNGHTVQVNLPAGYTVTGGGLPDIYNAQQFHFHWGSSDSKGSEHTINGDPSSAEMHIVCYDAGRYSSIGEAVKGNSPGALAVLSIMIEVDSQAEDNTFFEPLMSLLPLVIEPEELVEIPTPFSVRKMLPTNLQSFYRYKGSLTTPPCSEIVIWSIFEEKVIISSGQIKKFRALTHEGKDGKQPLFNNFRPVQPINGREIYETG